MLTWTTADDRGHIAATGGKGRYQIRWDRRGYVLTGHGHGDLPMLALPRRFDTLDAAKDRAAALERVKAVEAEVSGT